MRAIDDVDKRRARAVEPGEAVHAGPVKRDRDDEHVGASDALDDPEALPPAGNRIVPTENGGQSRAAGMGPGSGRSGTGRGTRFRRRSRHPSEHEGRTDEQREGSTSGETRGRRRNGR